MAYVQGDTHAALGIAGDTGLAGPKKRRRRRAKKAIRTALRAGTSTEGLNARLVAKLTGKQVRKAPDRAVARAAAAAGAPIPKAPQAEPRWLASARAARAEKKARDARHAERVAAGTTQKQLKAREKAARDVRHEERVAAGTTKKQLKAREETEARLAPGDVPPPPDRRLGWEWTGYEWVWASPLQELPAMFQSRDDEYRDAYSTGGGDPFDGGGRARVAAGAPESGLPSWLIPAAIGAAVYLL